MDPNVDPFQAQGGGVKVQGNWVPKNHPLAAQAQPQTPDAVMNRPGPGPATNPAPIQNTQQAVTQNATIGAQPQQGGQVNVAGAFQQALVNKLAPAPVNAQNPAIKGSIDANRLAEQRGLERTRNLAAERAHAGGYSGSGAFDSQLLGAEQARSAREGAFEGQQLGDLERQQSQQLMAALALAGGQLADQDRLGMQRYGIDTDAALRREGLGVQSSLGNRDLDLRGELGRGNLNLGLLGALMGNDQFGKSLSAQLGVHNSNLDANFWRNLL